MSNRILIIDSLISNEAIIASVVGLIIMPPVAIWSALRL